jgi:SAM-dependent methyltransferase
MTATDGKVIGHYDEQYFTRYSKHKELIECGNKFKFAKFINPAHRVLDFGCGSGELLKSLNCAERIGVEINRFAREECKQKGIRVYKELADIATASVDVAISNHALEHVSSPLLTVQEVREKLIPGGLAVFVVPCERYDRHYNHNDADQHLYTWSPSNLGNLFEKVGFEIIEARTVFHRWVPKPLIFRKLLGRRAFHIASAINGSLFRSLTQVRVIARRPMK